MGRFSVGPILPLQMFVVTVDAFHGPGAVFRRGGGTGMGDRRWGGKASGGIGVVVTIQASGLVERAPPRYIRSSSSVVVGVTSPGIATGILHGVVRVIAVLCG